MNAAAARNDPGAPSGGDPFSVYSPGPHTLDFLDTLPGDRRYELVDGVVSILDVGTNRHQDVSFNLAVALMALLPKEWKVLFAPGFSRDPFNYRVPDLAVCLVEVAIRNIKRAYLRPEETCLLCEVVSDSTVTVDRVFKPSEYASTGVPYYLRIELSSSGRVVKLYLHENIENRHRETDTDPERLFHQIAHTMTGGVPLPLPNPFTGPLDPNGL
jgi:Uma2 family endonuclease